MGRNLQSGRVGRRGRAGPKAQRFAAAIEDGPNLLVPTIVLLEVTRRVMQQRGEDDALQVAAVLHQGQVVPLDSGIAVNAARPSGRWTQSSPD